MADEGLERFEATLNAIAKITSDDRDLFGARCPKCDASDFVRVSDLYSETVGHLEIHPDSARDVGAGGMTNLQIVERFRPPRRKSVFGVTAAVAIPLLTKLRRLRSFLLFMYVSICEDLCRSYSRSWLLHRGLL